MKERNCYVYEDYRTDNWSCCYVGMGSKNEENGYNRFEVAERNDHHDNIMKSCGIARVIIRDNLTRKEANALEEARIYYYVFVLGYTIDIKGYRKGKKNDSHLTNQTWGGDGVKGCNPLANKTKEELEEWKKKQSEAHKGKNPYANKTEKELEEWRKKLSETMIKKGVTKGEKNPMFGKHHTKETCEKLKQIMKDRYIGEKNPMYGRTGDKNPNSKPVIGVNFNTGEVIELYGAKQGEELGFTPTHITACAKGKLKTHKGYKWYYKSDYEKLSKEETIEVNLNLLTISNINISI